MPSLHKAHRLFLALLGALSLLFVASNANATHFRYGNITYSVIDPVNAPTTVRFEVTMAWRSTFIDGSSLAFGDNVTNPNTQGFQIGSGTDAAGLQYVVMQYFATHTYPSVGQYTASFTSCCRLSNLINAGDANFLVTAKVDLTQPNVGNPIGQVPAVIQMQTGGVRSLNIGSTDPDGTPVTCRFATTAESSIPTNPPTQSGKIPTLATSVSPPGCTLTWDTTGGIAGNQFATQVVMESTKQNGTVNSGVLDFILEFVSSPPPKCTGSGQLVIDQGASFNTSVTGTVNAAVGGNLTMTSIGTMAAVSPIPGTVAASPFVTTLNGIAGAPGAYIQTIIYRDTLNSSGYCNVTVSVPACPQFGTPCGAGVGQCASTGYQVCNQGQVVCNAVAGQPAAELCNGLDDDCDGVNDNGNPESGMPCTSNAPGVCAAGLTTCPSGAGALSCVSTIQPGQLVETCNGLDDNCDGVTDEGYGLGQVCSVGTGACQTAGTIICDANGGTVCSAVAGNQTPEVCDGVDNDCNGVVDDGIGLGDACTNGLGVCTASGQKVCDGAGGLVCDATPGSANPETCGDGTDEDCDGALDNGCVDSDGDGIFDSVEVANGTNLNDADSDDDGLPDGQEPGFAIDPDGDGLINGLDVDSDNDGLYDGTEMGLACDADGTNAALGHCRADADLGATKTDALVADTDGGGVLDGSEDANLNGAVDAGEVDPLTNGDDGGATDGDNDGMSDALEVYLGLAVADKDSDDDGVLDGLEANPSDDRDGDGSDCAADADSDNDGLFDGTEVGAGCDDPDTNAAASACKADGDPGARTSPLLWDTDKGGASDGSEDANLNGVLGNDETDPNDGSDDGQVIDMDGDGLGDALELAIGSNPGDADSDDDGALDGKEPNPGQDFDGDGLANAADPDSDGDGLWDGTELGFGCADPSTNLAKDTCIPDGDSGATKTSPIDADSDGGGQSDGVEDANHNGIVDMGETNPLLAADDVPPPECVTDADCASSSVGPICSAQGVCIEGCRGTGPACAEGLECSSTDDTIGTCSEPEAPPASTPAPAEDTGCGCRTAGGAGDAGLGGAALAAALGLVIARRRRTRASR